MTLSTLLSTRTTGVAGLDHELFVQKKMLVLKRDSTVGQVTVQPHFVLRGSGQGKLLLTQCSTHEFLRNHELADASPSEDVCDSMRAELTRVTFKPFNPAALVANVCAAVVAKLKGGGRKASSRSKPTATVQGRVSGGGGVGGGGGSSGGGRKPAQSKPKSSASSNRTALTITTASGNVATANTTDSNDFSPRKPSAKRQKMSARRHGSSPLSFGVSVSSLVAKSNSLEFPNGVD